MSLRTPFATILHIVCVIIFSKSGLTTGAFLGGYIIAMTPMFFSAQLQNYAGNFLISASCSAVCFMWTLVFVREKPTTERDITASRVIDEQSSRNEKMPLLKQENCGSPQVKSNQSFWCIFKDIINYNNVLDVYRVSVKPRPGTTRLRMWLMILTINLSILPAFGRIAVIYPLVQKLYKWDSVMYSNLATLSGVIHIFAIILIIPVMFKVFKTNDCQTAMIGILSGIIADVFIGSIVSPMGFYLHALISSLGGVAGTGARAYLSKLLPNEEVSKIFAVTLMTEALLKAIGSFLFTFLLQVTISFYATFVFHFMAVILVIALTIVVFVDLTTPYPLL